MYRKIFNILIIIILSSSAYSQNKLSLEEIINIALQNNQGIKSSKLNIEKEEAIKLKAFNIPKLGLFAEYEGIKGSINNFENRKLGISQEIEFPSAYFLRSDVQSSQVQIAKAELNRLINELKFEVKQNYYNLLFQIKMHELANENLKIYEDFLFIASRKYEVGSTSNLEVLSAKVNKIKFENNIKNIESQIRVNQSSLKKMMNVDYIIIPEEDLKYTEVTLAKENLLAAAFSNNPELSIVRFQKEKFSNKILLSKAELLPGLSFRYYNQKIGNESGFWGFEVGIGIPLWFWWEQTGSIKEANYEYKISSSDEINIRKSIESELNQAFEEYQNNIRQLNFFTYEALAESDEILRQAKISFEEGAISYVELLQALTVAYDIKTQNLYSVFNYNYSIIKLEKITAGDIK